MPETIAYQVALSILSFIGTTGNFFTNLALTKCSKLRQKSTTKFVISLALSGLLYCALNMPYLVWMSSKEFELNVTMCPFYGMVYYTPTTLSLITLMAIAINRYMIVCHNGIYVKFYSGYKAVLHIVMIWIMGFGYKRTIGRDFIYLIYIPKIL